MGFLKQKIAHLQMIGMNGSAEICNLHLTLITVVADAKVLLVQLTGELIMNGFLCKIKNWMLLIHSATLEIRSVLGVVAI